MIHDIGLIQNAGGRAKSLDDIQSVFDSTNALDMLNAKYIIYNPDEAPLLNPKALGNAWLVETPEIVRNANQELSEINKMDPSKVAVIDEKFSSQVKKSSYPLSEGDTIWLKSYKPNELIYGSDTKGDDLAVFSEIYYPAGWKCYVDGKESIYFRCDYVLRGMIVPAGKHEIKFSFHPSSFTTGRMVSYLSSIIFLVLAAAYAVFSIRKSSKSG